MDDVYGYASQLFIVVTHTLSFQVLSRLTSSQHNFFFTFDVPFGDYVLLKPVWGWWWVFDFFLIPVNFQICIFQNFKEPPSFHERNTKYSTFS
jgi:hypothetical protein